MSKAILLADDSLTIQKVVELTFSDTNYELTTVANGVEALEALKKFRPDLVIADVVMPGKNGYEVCEAVKTNPATANIPVILLSGTFEPFDRERAEKARADAIVTKPFDSKNLLSQVEMLLASAAPAAPEETSAPEPEEASFLTQAFPTSSAPAPSPEEALAPPALPTPPPPPDMFVQAEPDLTFEESPEPVPGDIQSAIAAYERESAGLSTEGLEKLAEPAFAEREEITEVPSPPAPAPAVPFVPPPIPRLVESAPVEPLDFTLDDTSAFGKPEAEELPPVDEMAVFSEGDNVFDFPTGPPPAPAAEAEPVTSADFGGEEVFPEEPPAAPASVETEPAPAVEPPAAVSGSDVSADIERLAQNASISDLASMVHRVAPAASLSDEDLDRLSRRVIEHLSDQIIREIAWEVIPDLAEMVVRKRIQELEAEAASDSE